MCAWVARTDWIRSKRSIPRSFAGWQGPLLDRRTLALFQLHSSPWGWRGQAAKLSLTAAKIQPVDLS
jgi:hypothetical protein